MRDNDLLDWLRSNEFQVEHSEFFHPKFIFCKKEHTNVIIKEYNNSQEVSQVRSDAVDVRSILTRVGENAWNTYFLVCNSSTDYILPYSIEKDSVGLRKYIINSYEDFKRIPFLDDREYQQEVIDDIGQVKIFDKENMDEIVEHIVGMDGLQRELEEKEVMEILESFYDVVIEYED
jgi:hypothetical protein